MTLWYNRGDQWYVYIDSILKICKTQYNVPPSKVFFIISSMVNGLDNTHVQKLLGEQVSNAELVMDQTLLKSYLNEYVDDVNSLPNPHSQIFFAGAELHPNVLATEWLNTGIEPKGLDKYSWLQPSVSDLIDSLSNID